MQLATAADQVIGAGEKSQCDLRWPAAPMLL